ncbi:MAG: 3'-5' exonuclease domain-containing protein 2, partial [Candidatus Omnitrophica bacterium]|nr:3'-5' exonuclease domain-containing protein 2 [Candidatus Omnitrophota bacterium]
VLKAGIAVDDDIKKLSDLFPLGSSGFVELAGMAHKAGIKNAGLRGLAALLFGFRISKQTKCSRWDTPALTREQIVYAATDAWICRELYFALNGILHGKPHISL